MKIFRILVAGFLFLYFTVSPAQAYLPSDPLYPAQTYLKQIAIEEAWEVARGKGVIVAVLDAGIDINHPDLKFNIWTNEDEVAADGLDNDLNGYVDDINGWNFWESNNDPRPQLTPDYDQASIGHGTAIAGLIGAVANNGQGIVGVAFNAKIMPLKILGSDGLGEVKTLIDGIKYAVNNGAQVINLSLVGYEKSSDLENVLRWAEEKGVVVVAAAGNTEEELNGLNLDILPAYPACYGDQEENNWVVAVSAVDQNDFRALFSNYGSKCIDLSAPGKDILSLGFYQADNDNFQDYYISDWSGTSFATALVAGVAALIKAKDQSLSAAEVIKTIINNTDNIDKKNYSYQGKLGSGRLNAQKSLAAPLAEKIGRLVRLADSSAVYYVGADDVRHLFPNEPIYWSWYSGAWAEQKIEIISQVEFDQLAVGANLKIRPGTNLVKFNNSPRIYAVATGGLLYHLTADLAKKIYGDDYQTKIAIIQVAFESDYQRVGEMAAGFYPNGSLLEYHDNPQIYYLDQGRLRAISGDGLAANNFFLKFLIKEADPKVTYNLGEEINQWEGNIFSYKISTND